MTEEVLAPSAQANVEKGERVTVVLTAPPESLAFAFLQAEKPRSEGHWSEKINAQMQGINL
ncbi:MULTISPECIES: hypothetical protein [unclassified Pseudomonas]|uniref:hypothetical protein n=1 Tax=unclassified Pseudomonas TaxID=196821 RepID=UPI0011136989|nr:MULTISPECIES: hypothetical protein [unclassified Pseudomonas]